MCADIGLVVRTFNNRLLELSIVPDDRFCGCPLNVLTQTPTEEGGKVIGCMGVFYIYVLLIMC